MKAAMFRMMGKILALPSIMLMVMSTYLMSNFITFGANLKVASEGMGTNGKINSVGGVGVFVRDLSKNILGPVFVVIGVFAVIFAVKLGIDYAKAEDSDARKKKQGQLIGALIGAVIIIAGATLCFSLDFVAIVADMTGEGHEYVEPTDGSSVCTVCGCKSTNAVHNQKRSFDTQTGVWLVNGVQETK